MKDFIIFALDEMASQSLDSLLRWFPINDYRSDTLACYRHKISHHLCSIEVVLLP